MKKKFKKISLYFYKKLSMIKKKIKGFTLIELLVIIAIIGVLSSVVLSSLNSARMKARNVVRLSTVKSLVNAFNLSNYDTGTFPNTGGVWTCLSISCTGDWATYVGDNDVDTFFLRGMPEKPTDPSGDSRGVSGYLYIHPWTNSETGESNAWLKYAVENPGSCGSGAVFASETTANYITCLLSLDVSGLTGLITGGAGGGGGGGGETLFAPVVTTDPVSNITSTTVTGGGNISSDGGDPIIVSGIVWSTLANPTTLLLTKTTDGPTSGSWSDNITGLSSGTTYHVRAYATNSVGTSYGDDVMFTTTNALVECTGGTITRTGGYTIHKFTSSGTLSCASDQTVDYLVVAGGGGGGNSSSVGGGTGGGAGGLLSGTALSINAGSYTVTVGAGGVAGTMNVNPGAQNKGGNSVFGSIVATGGGAGVANGVGQPGGSGSGGWRAAGGAASPAGQGNAGGVGNNPYFGGAGGGAGGAGGNATAVGPGLSYSISSSSVTYATGGPAYGGGVGTANTGNGGSGGQGSAYAGGSGIVVVRYLTP